MSTIGSVVLDKVYATAVRENYAAIMNEIAPPKIEDVVVGLEEHFAKLGDLAQCDQCGGWSPEKLPDGTAIEACPFCNDGKKDDAPPAPPPPVPSAAVVDITPPKKKEKAAALASSAPILAAMPSNARVAVSEKELDEAIARFERAAESGADSTYLMGVEIRRMRDFLWQQRTEGGKPKYKSYNQFVEQELGISVGLANRFRRIVENFTIEEFRKHGAAALKSLIAAPKEEHAALLRRHEEGASTSDLEQEVRQIRDGRGIAVVDTDATLDAAASGKDGPSASATAAGARARKKEAAAITVGLREEEIALKFMARPGKKTDEPRAARAMADRPYAEVKAMNSVTIYIALKVTPAGEIVGKMTARRDDAEE